MTPEGKMVMALGLPLTTFISPEFGFALAFGIAGGWAARAGVSLKERKPIEEIKRDFIVMLLLSVGSVVTTLFFASLLEANALGLAAIGFVVAFSGTDSFDFLKRFIFAPILGAIRDAGEKK